MVEPADAKELIDAAIERAEEERDVEQKAERAQEKTFRDRVSVLVGILAVTLAVIHMAAASAARESLLKGIEASDTFNYMQAKIIREAVFKTAAGASLDDKARAEWAKEASRLRSPDAAGHGIDQLRASGERLRDEGERAAHHGEGYETGETALQVAIVLLSIRSLPVPAGLSQEPSCSPSPALASPSQAHWASGSHDRTQVTCPRI